MSEINTHGLICDFGKHKGLPYTRLPVSYLKWLVNTPGHRAQEIARAELQRRGTTTPTIEVSGHAIDRASLSCRKQWHQTSNEGEGLHAWLCRIAQEARERGEPRGDKIAYAGMRFAFEQDGRASVEATVAPQQK